MDVLSLVAAAVGMVAGYLEQVAGGVLHRMRDSAIEGLYGMVAERMRRTAVGASVLGELEAHPGDAAKRAQAVRALHDAISANPEELESLDAAVARVRLEQSSMVTGSGASGGAQLAVGPHAAMTMPRGVIAGGDVDQSRVFHFRLGGLVVLLAAVAIFGAAIGGTTTYLRTAPERGQDLVNGGEGRAGLPVGPIPVSAVPADAVKALQSDRFCSQDGSTGCKVVDAQRPLERMIDGRAYDDVLCVVYEYKNFRGLSGELSTILVRDTLLWKMIENSGRDEFLRLGCTNY